MDAAAHGPFSRAVEARAAAREEEVQHLVTGRLLGGGCIRGVDVVVEHSRQQQPRLHGRIERLVLAPAAAQHELWRQGAGHVGEHVAHRGIELGGAPAHAQRARIEREDLRHDGTLREQVQGHQPQRVQGGQPRREIGQARRRNVCDGLEQFGPRLQRATRALRPGDGQAPLVVDDKLQATFGQGCAIVRRRSGVHDFPRLACNAHAHAARHLAEVAAAKEHRVGRQHLPQRLAQLGDGGEVEPVEHRRIIGRRGAIPRGARVNGEQRLSRGRHAGGGIPVDAHAMPLQQPGQIQPTQAEDEKRIAVDLLAEQVDHRRQVLARHGPVGA
jgi:hypothetical protein